MSARRRSGVRLGVSTKSINWARYNHVFIPTSSAERDRFRASRVGRALAPITGIWASLTDEGRTLAPVTLVVGALAVDVRGTSAYVLFCVLFGVLFGSILAARGIRLRGARIHVDAPRRVTVGEAVTFFVRVVRDRDGPPAALRVRGPFLPWDGTWLERAPAEVPLDREATTSMRARFVARGVHHLDPFTAAAIAPLGLACGRRIGSDALKVTVVPKIANVTKLPLALSTRHQPGGVALASKTGESMDLLGVRPYRPGDPVRDLSARIWARTGYAVVREYVQEHFTRVGVVLDTDIDDPERLEEALQLAAGVIAHLSRGEALVDVLVVGDAVHELVLGRSLGYLDQALDLLSTVERSKAISSEEIVRRLDPYVERLSSLVLISTEARRGAHEALVSGVRRRGVVPTTLVLDDDVAGAIQRGEPLSW